MSPPASPSRQRTPQDPPGRTTTLRHARARAAPELSPRLRAATEATRVPFHGSAVNGDAVSAGGTSAPHSAALPSIPLTETPASVESSEFNASTASQPTPPTSNIRNNGSIETEMSSAASSATNGTDWTHHSGHTETMSPPACNVPIRLPSVPLEPPPPAAESLPSAPTELLDEPPEKPPVSTESASASESAADTTPSTADTTPSIAFETIHVATRLLRMHRHAKLDMTPSQAAALAHAVSSTTPMAVTPIEQRSPSFYALSSTLPTEPGAYHVWKHRLPGTVSYQIRVPPHVRPGHEFEVETNGRRVQVVCPVHATVNDTLEIAVPHPATYQFQPLKVAQLTASPTLVQAVGMQHPATTNNSSSKSTIPVVGGAYLMIPDITRINEQAVSAGGTVRTHVVTIPETVAPGQRFRVQVHGERFYVVCPDTCRPGSRIRIVPPPVVDAPPSNVQTFAVQIPRGVTAGGQFTVLVDRQQVLVECPPSAGSGQTVHIQLPTAAVTDTHVQLTYSSGSGWIRTIRASDMKFQWVRVDQAVVDDRITNKSGVFDFGKSAYVRKLVEHEGNDPRLRTATMALATAEQAVVDSKFKTQSGDVLFTYADIIALQGHTAAAQSDETTALARKHAWFLSVCQKLTESVTQPDPMERSATVAGETELSIKLLVRREHLLADSIRAVLSLGADDMRRKWEIEFVGEPGFDRGGLTREWFECVTEQIFKPHCKLFVSSVNNQAAVDINPAIGMICPDSFLQSYRFVGRVIGRGLFTGHLMRGHLVRLLYKHLLGWPTTHEDVKDLDQDLHTGLLKLTQMEDVSVATLDFTATEDCFGSKINQELIVDGSSIAVTNDNVDAYLEQNIRYRTFNRILPQLTELLLGFYDVVPEAALTVFDVSELELVLCGLPTIDMLDWQAHTLYSGLYQYNGNTMSAVRWFWDVVEHDFDDEMKARLLQFTTGTSGVNLEGFANLQGSDGNIKKFTIHGVDPERCFYPKSHTCFNQLDLPNYATRELLKERLTVSITTSYVGFDTK